MSAGAAQPLAPGTSAAPPTANAARAGARMPLCFIVDSDASTRHFLSLIMHGAGIDTEEFADGRPLADAMARRTPDAVFLNVALDLGDAIGSVEALGQRGYSGYLQLMSSRGAAVLAHVKGFGDQHRLLMLPPLKKPLDNGTIVKLLRDLKFGESAGVAGRVDLDEALANGWIEFWYQPTIDLRRKQLVGVEAFARARHPIQGVLTPGAFMPGATESGLVALSELALAHSLRAGLAFSRLGVSLRLAVNIPVNALVKIPLAELVQTYRPQYEKWPGLIIDVTEEQIVTELKLASDIGQQLAPLNVKLAIDHCGRGYSSLARLKELPFAEIKLDRAFVVDCGTDKTRAPLCKAVIDLAHNFGAIAVAIGIEKAADALALVSMGCDYGQGFLLGQPMPEERFLSLLRQRTTPQKQPASATATVTPSVEKRPT
jgi:EAL domain-containing protein (putative c-di-GMP-specific phosphodiesterase class I)/CheY-like chemotaxis protein